MTESLKFPEKRPSSKYFTIYWATWPLSRLFYFTAVAQKQLQYTKKLSITIGKVTVRLYLQKQAEDRLGCSFLLCRKEESKVVQ